MASFALKQQYRPYVPDFLSLCERNYAQLRFFLPQPSAVNASQYIQINALEAYRITVLAEAPGYIALMAIVGGAMLGYWATGNWKMDNSPASIRMMAMTQAKIGRSIKNRDMTYSSGLGFWASG